MSVEAKQTLIKDVERALSDVLTVSEMEKLVDALNENMSSYSIERTEGTEGNQDFEEMLMAYLDAKRIEGRSEKTIERYRYVLGKLTNHTKTPIRNINVFHLRAFLMEEKRRGVSDRTLEGYREIYSAFFGWLYKEGLLKCNPCANLSAIRCQKKVRLPYTNVDIEKLKESCTNDRDKAIVSFLLSTGCRISEVCSIDRDDIDFTNRECVVLGKGNKERTVFMDEVTTMLLERYLQGRTDDSEALFVGKGTTRMKPGGIRRMLKTVAKKAGVENVHPHRFRRTFATGMIGRGMPIQEVAAILGHDKIDTTMKYVYLSKDSVKRSFQKYA